MRTVGSMKEAALVATLVLSRPVLLLILVIGAVMGRLTTVEVVLLMVIVLHELEVVYFNKKGWTG